MKKTKCLHRCRLYADAISLHFDYLTLHFNKVFVEYLLSGMY